MKNKETFTFSGQPALYASGTNATFIVTSVQLAIPSRILSTIQTFDGTNS